VDSLTDDEVTGMMSNSESFDKFFNDLPIVKTIHENEDAARAAEASTKELREKEKELRTRVNAANEQIKDHERELAKINAGSSHTQDEIVAMLSEKRDEADDECSELVMKLNCGEIKTMDFAREFRKIRLLYHLRNAKIESAARGAMKFGN